MNGKSIRLEGLVRDVVASGESVVESERGLVFVRGGLPGERLRFELEAKRGRVQRGRLLQVLEPSAARVEPVCRHAGRCGGCALMHAAPDEQRKLRLAALRSALRKVAGEIEITLHEATEQLAYRRRARLAFRVRGKRAELGFRRERSHELSDIEQCAVLDPVLASALVLLRERLLPSLTGEGEIRLAHGAQERAVLVLTSESVQTPALYALCEALVREQQLAGIALYIAGASRPASFGDAREWSVGFDGAPLEGAIGGFSQAHASINQTLVARVAAHAQVDGARVLELYAGAGNLTVALAAHAASYVAVEQAPEAVVALRHNLERRALRAKVVEADARQYAARAAAADVVVLDPPRIGAQGVLAALCAHKPRRIVYVSCDAATLARDLGELDGRHAVRAIEAFEMFPQTPDLELLAHIERVR